MRDSLKASVNDKKVLFELYRVEPVDLEPRQDIPKARIAIYFLGELDLIKIGAEKPSDSRQQIGIDVSYKKGYRGDDATKGELPLLDLKDKVVDWVKEFDAYSATDGFLSSLGYDGARTIYRNSRYITMTMQLSGHRDLIKNQTNT